MGWSGVGWDNNVHVPVHTQAWQPHHLQTSVKTVKYPVQQKEVDINLIMCVSVAIFSVNVQKSHG